MEYRNIQQMATTPGSIERYGIQVFNKWPQENAWLKRAIGKTQIFNKWPKQTTWLKRAIWNTQIFNKWPQETPGYFI